MKKIRFFLYITIVLILNACQGRDMPIKIVDSKSTHETNSSQPSKIKKHVKKLNIIVTEKKKTILKKKSIQQSKQKTSTIKKNNSAPLKSIQQKREDKTPYIKGLPPLPNLEKNLLHSLEKSKQKKRTISKQDDKSIDEIIDTKVAQPKESFSGGDIINSLDMATIRIGKSSDYTSIIFDSYVYEGTNTFPSTKAPASGIYLFTYEPSKKRIVGLIDGYNAFSALLTNQRKLFTDSKVVENIYVLKHLGKDGIKFVIQLRKNVRVNIFDVKNPGRIIVNLFPL